MPGRRCGLFIHRRGYEPSQMPATQSWSRSLRSTSLPSAHSWRSHDDELAYALAHVEDLLMVELVPSTSPPGKLRAAPPLQWPPYGDPETSQHVGDHEDRRQHHQTEKDLPYHAPHENLLLIRIIPLPSYPFPGVPRRELSVN